ncbi:SIS domain-containing protein [Sphingomonas sp. MMS24-JH45]
MLTVARGSSDHAATYAKYLIETLVGTPVASAAPSPQSRRSSPRRWRRAACLGSSSRNRGEARTCLLTVAAQKAAGATLAAFVNDERSPLAGAADTLLALKAGPERSVAATKSCLAAMAGLALLVAEWADDADLRAALARLPDDLASALALDWCDAVAALRGVERMYVIGRGYGLGIAGEAALKLKEDVRHPGGGVQRRRGAARPDGDRGRGGFRCSPSPRTMPRGTTCARWRRCSASAARACCWPRQA